MATNIEASETMGTVIRTGTVIAVCYSAELINGVGKEPHESGEITRLGIPGDRHYGETRVSPRLGVIPNDRPITIVGVEGVRDVCEQLDVPTIPPGGLGENLLIEGMGDLGDILPGDLVRVLPADSTEPSVILLARLQNEPCSNLQIYHKLNPSSY